MRVNRTRFAVLGLLSFGPRSGYEIKRELEETMSHFWSESLGQIYPTLRRLVEEGLATAQRESQDSRPDCIRYVISAAGRKVLKEWLEVPPSPQQVRNELLLKLFFGPEASLATMRHHIERYQGELQDLKKHYDMAKPEMEEEARSPEQKLCWSLSLDLGQHIVDARLRWCKRAIKAIDDFESTNARRGRRKSGSARK